MGHARKSQTWLAGKTGSAQRNSPRNLWTKLSQTLVAIPFAGGETREKIIRKRGNRLRLPPREGETQGVLVTEFVDNRDVVPYNPYQLLCFECHINVEICSSIAAVKYPFKYVYKGHDFAVFKIDRQERGPGEVRVNNWDEISSYLDTRYLSAPTLTPPTQPSPLLWLFDLLLQIINCYA